MTDTLAQALLYAGTSAVGAMIGAAVRGIKTSQRLDDRVERLEQAVGRLTDGVASVARDVGQCCLTIARLEERTGGSRE